MAGTAGPAAAAGPTAAGPTAAGPAAAGPAALGQVGRLPDLRLLAPSLAGWATAFWAVARPAQLVTVVAVMAGTLAAGSCAVLLRAGRRSASRRWSGPQLRHRRGDLLAAGALTLAVVTGILACTAFQLTGRSSGPLPGWVADGAIADLDVQAMTDPRAVGAGRYPGPPRVAVQVQAHRIGVRGRDLTTSVPMLVLAPAGSGAGSWASVTAGQRVLFLGRLTPAEAGDEPVALVSARGAPRRVEAGSWPWRVADRVRAGLRRACGGLSPDSAGLLPSLVVGDTSALPARLQADLKAAGLTHLTAVSGANVAILVAAVTWLAASAGASRRVRLTVSALGVAGFVILARPSPSVLRAAAMAAVALAGLASARRPRGLPVLACAVVLLLAGNPWLGRNPGFALSVVATGGLLLLAPVWAARLSRWMPRPLAVALAAPAAAQAVCGPVLILLAPSVSLVSVPANLLAEPAVAPATLLGVAAAALSLVWPAGAHLVAWFGGLATDWIALVAHRGAAMPLANLPWPGGLGGAVLLALLTAALIRATTRGRGSDSQARRPRRRFRPVGVLAVIGCAVAAGWFVLPFAGRWIPLPGAGVPDSWFVVMCDVGQGDALVVRSGPDRAVLVDAGPAPDAVDRCLRRLGVRHLDLIVITHLHADHAFGLPGALRGRDVAAIWVSPLAEPTANAEAVRRWAAAGGVHPLQAWAGARGSSGRDGWTAQWRVLEPRVPPTASGDVAAADGTVVNESSVALLLDVEGPAGRVRLLDLADLETARQQGLATRLRSEGESLDGSVDVVKVSHHGSARQWSPLYAWSGARVGLIGVGAGNDYGHPTTSALDLLTGLGIVVVRTDLGGDLVVERKPDGLRVTPLG